MIRIFPQDTEKFANNSLHEAEVIVKQNTSIIGYRL